MSLRSFYYLNNSFNTLAFNREELDEFQSRMAKSIILEAEDSRLYENWSDVTREFVEECPFTDSKCVKSQIGDNQGLNDEKLERRSSGSTGDPVRIQFNRQAHDWLSAIYIRTLLLQGYRPLEKICQLWEGMSNQRSLFGRLLMPKEYIDPGLELEEQIDMLNSAEPGVLQYFPMTLLAICKKIRRDDIDFFSPKLVITYGEVITPQIREFIEKTLDTKLVDQYNMTEFGVVAWQCPERGYHLVEDAVYPEIIGPNGEKVEAEGKGELVLTGLVNKETPLVRYCTGDIVELTEKECSCNTNFRRIKRVIGRKNRIIRNSNGESVYPSEIADFLGPLEDILFFQLKDREDKIILNYVPNGDIQEDSVNYIENQLSDKFDLSEIEAIERESIEKTSGGKMPVIRKI